MKHREAHGPVAALAAHGSSLELPLANPRAQGLVCTSCAALFDRVALYECTVCGGILEVRYDYAGLTPQRLSATRDLLPNRDISALSLGEGDTPLLKANRLAQRVGVRELLLKCEFTNPTGSFKDRPVAVGIAMAVEFGFAKVIAASSGNGAAATAAYAARAGLTAVIVVPSSTPNEKVRQTQSYGATVIRVEGGYSSCFTLVKEIAATSDLYNVTTTFLNPYTVEGDKSVGYELVEQREGGPIDYIFVPIGAGPLLVGIAKGFDDYRRLRSDMSIPGMVGVQATGNNPVVRAYRKGASEVVAQTESTTIAGGIADGLVGYTKDGDHTLKYIRHTKGFALDVTDDEILEAQNWLATEEGVFVEPSAAASVAAINRGVHSSTIDPDSTVVAMLTGHGLKDMGNIGQIGQAVTVSNDLQHVKAALSEHGN